MLRKALGNSDTSYIINVTAVDIASRLQFLRYIRELTN